MSVSSWALRSLSANHGHWPFRCAQHCTAEIGKTWLRNALAVYARVFFGLFFK